MSISTDFHNHVVRSSARQMVESANSKGIRVLGLSEHIFQMREVRPYMEHMHLEGRLLPFAEYVEEVRNASRDTEVDVRLGLEVDFIPEKNELLQRALQDQPWDFLIGSVHEIDGVLFESINRLERDTGEQLWARYYTLLCEAVDSGYFNVISHPVRMRVTNPFLPATLDDELDRLAMKAAHANVALELNGYDTLHYIDLVQRLAQACARHKTPVSIGSDAHYPAKIAQAHQETEQLLREAGITHIRVWKQRQAEEYTL